MAGLAMGTSNELTIFSHNNVTTGMMLEALPSPPPFDYPVVDLWKR